MNEEFRGQCFSDVASCKVKDYSGVWVGKTKPDSSRCQFSAPERMMDVCELQPRLWFALSSFGHNILSRQE